MKLFATTLILSLIIINSLVAQETEEDIKIKAFEDKIEINQQKIESFKKSIDSLNVIASKKKFETLDGKGISCKAYMTARVKSTPEVFGKEIFQIPNKKIIQVISYVSNSDNYFRVLFEGKFGFMSEIYFDKDCDLEFLKKEGIPYNKEKDFLGEEIRSPNLTPSKSTKSSKPSSTYRYGGSNKIHTGPRGGKYYINSNGKKTYIKH